MEYLAAIGWFFIGVLSSNRYYIHTAVNLSGTIGILEPILFLESCLSFKGLKNGPYSSLKLSHYFKSFKLGWLFGIQALAGLLLGSLLVATGLAIFQSNAGGAWDNAKKYIEQGFLGGKGTDAHKASVVGDTVGDPFKDTSGPSLNILMKLSAILSLVFVPFFVKHGGVLLRFFE